MEYMVRATAAAACEPGREVSIAIDAAASRFLRDGKYRLRSEGRLLNAAEMVELYRCRVSRFPVVAIEDALAEDDWQRATAVLVKMNQIGIPTEALPVGDRAGQPGFAAVVSARSGETEDSLPADLAVATGAGHVKVGSATRSERLAKHDRLLWIEAERTEGLAPVRPLGHHGTEGGVRVSDA